MPQMVGNLSTRSKLIGLLVVPVAGTALLGVTRAAALAAGTGTTGEGELAARRRRVDRALPAYRAGASAAWSQRQERHLRDRLFLLAVACWPPATGSASGSPAPPPAASPPSSACPPNGLRPPRAAGRTLRRTAGPQGTPTGAYPVVPYVPHGWDGRRG